MYEQTINKLADSMEAGFLKVGKQEHNTYFHDDYDRLEYPTAACGMGCAMVGLNVHRLYPRNFDPTKMDLGEGTLYRINIPIDAIIAAGIETDTYRKLYDGPLKDDNLFSLVVYMNDHAMYDIPTMVDKLRALAGIMAQIAQETE